MGHVLTWVLGDTHRSKQDGNLCLHGSYHLPVDGFLICKSGDDHHIDLRFAEGIDEIIHIKRLVQCLATEKVSPEFLLLLTPWYDYVTSDLRHSSFSSLQLLSH